MPIESAWYSVDHAHCSIPSAHFSSLLRPGYGEHIETQSLKPICEVRRETNNSYLHYFKNKQMKRENTTRWWILNVIIGVIKLFLSDNLEKANPPVLQRRENVQESRVKQGKQVNKFTVLWVLLPVINCLLNSSSLLWNPFLRLSDWRT